MLDPLAASDILADLGYMLAPVAGSIGGVAAKERGDVFSTLMDGAKDEDGGSGSNIDIAIEKAVIGFFDRYSKEKQRELFSQLAKITMVIMPDGKEPRLSDIFQAHFRGRVKSMYRWFFFAMKTQFEDFFSGQDGAISRAVEKVMGTVGQPTS
jgi:hypothetical protein